ncbi:hypothetical protein CONPUDRAFT_150127 [Coniophora puteana RWD-64-598 SS2]|uniref:DUF4219 domain-containing protein n=1 Tax=Coniophora puteana (strain RWD-64-598) TaxID=741705 RepID=A0A5M3N322_CONPW|nr:uncharacterized protein CONPUDRAFT_150127 [Coniophora puteana RWD-64-598 SS2]EIW85311.1 hypothetical protein CONPUDRAFT_150127 [Coniophora puteana RWD-64-598 SS2]
MPDADASKRIKALTKDNYASWAVDISALARSKGFYRLLKGTETRPQDPDKAEDWDTRQEKAAGELMLSLSEEQRIHVKGKEDDPTAMWDALQAVHQQKIPGTRFNAFDDFFALRKRPEESLSSLIARVDTKEAQNQPTGTNPAI